MMTLFTVTLRVAAVMTLVTSANVRAELEWQAKDVEAAMDAEAKSADKSFSIKNTGGKTVRIQRVEADCPCVSFLAKPVEIAPGETGIITVRFERGGRVGTQRKRISVFTDDVRDSAFSFTWDIRITEIVRIQPLFMHWLRSGGKEMKEARIDVVHDGAKLNGWRLESDAFRAGEEKDGNAMKLQVTPLSTADPSRARLIVDILMPDQTIRSYPIRLIVR